MKKTLKSETLIKYFNNKDYTYEDVCETFAAAIKAYIDFNREMDKEKGKNKSWIRYIPLSFKVAENINHVDHPGIGKELVKEILPYYETDELYKFLNEYGVINRKEYLALKKKVQEILDTTNRIIKEFKEQNPDKRLNSKSKAYFKLYNYIDYYDHCFSIEEFQKIYERGGG